MSLSRRAFLKTSAVAGLASFAAPGWLQRPGEAAARAEGPFLPTWESLEQYRTPDWFRDAKFGIWAHWGPQCQPGQGDWYGRHMYEEGNWDYTYQVEHYGHPSAAGFKDVIRQWRAEEWDPQHLIGLYKSAGAKYFMCMANHHDNFDNYASTYQPWNSVTIGPKRDIVGGWEKEARAAGLRFAVSVHAAHAWSWYETSQGADATGSLKGIPYDGHLSKADGKGHWWEGLDPQDLYAQAHAPMGLDWEWHNGGKGDLPSQAYIEKFSRRTIELIDKYHPDQIYFDDTVVPFYPISDAGLRIVAHLYNSNMKRRHGRLEAVVNGKILNEHQRKCLVMDLENGISNRIEPLPFQTDTCIGSWHYDLGLYQRHGYKTADQVAHMLVDIVSKNGNLMLNIPLPGSGMPDPDALKFLADFTKWMKINSQGIYGTRPWGVFGEGPASQTQGHNRHYTARDFRFMQRNGDLFAFALAWPDDGRLLVRSLANGGGRVEDVRLLGHPGKLTWSQTSQGLAVNLPAQKPCDYVYGLHIRGRGLTPVPFVELPNVVEPRSEGVIILTPDTATLQGDSPEVESKAGLFDIGYWSNASDTVSWDFDVKSPGVYEVTMDTSCADNAESKFTLEAAGQTLSGANISTGSWDTFKKNVIGTITFSTVGKQTLTIKPQPDWKGIALRSVTLTKSH